MGAELAKEPFRRQQRNIPQQSLLVHACCAVIMYCLWFSKSFDVRASTMISTSGMRDVENVLALMVMQSRPFLESQWDCPDLPGLKSLVRIRLNTKASYLMTDNQKSPLTENSTGDELCRFCRYCNRRQPNARCRYSNCSGTTRQLP